MLGLFSGSATGRLLRYHPETCKTEVCACVCTLQRARAQGPEGRTTCAATKVGVGVPCAPVRHSIASSPPPASQVLVEGLWYANGVALARNGSFVLVAETNRLRVLRYWLRGPRAGTTETLIDRLPGFPDGVSLAADGHSFWVALVAPVTALPRLLRFKALRVRALLLEAAEQRLAVRQALPYRAVHGRALTRSCWRTCHRGRARLCPSGAPRSK
jgi:hypothetical protein